MENHPNQELAENHSKQELGEEPKSYESQSPDHADLDVEHGDLGIKHLTNPLARKLKGRHMQVRRLLFLC